MHLNKLEEAMKQRGINKKEMCEKLGMSRSAFYRKCKGKSEFTLEEVKVIGKILHLKSIEEIFFAKDVS